MAAHAFCRTGSQGAPCGRCGGLWPRSSPKHPLEMGLATGVSHPSTCLSWASPWGPSREQNDDQLGDSGRNPGPSLTLSLTFSMVASSDTSYTTHTTFACWGGQVAQHYQRLPVYTTRHSQARQGMAQRPGSHPSLVLLSQCSSAVSLGWMVICCANLRRPFPAHFQVPAPRLWSVSPLKAQGMHSHPRHLVPQIWPWSFTPVPLGRKDAENSTPGHSRSRRGTGQGCGAASSQGLGPDTCPPGNR